MIPASWRDELKRSLRPVPEGRVCRMVGLHLEVEGVDAAVGEAIRVEIDGSEKILAEVVAISDGRLVCMPFAEMAGVRFGATAVPLNRAPAVAVGRSILGRIVDANGSPIDGQGPIEAEDMVGVLNAAPAPLVRPIITEQMPLGVRVVDTMVPCGKGQRLGIFAGAGVGKSSLVSMAIRGTKAPVKVLALIGERGREVREFIERDLGEEGLSSAAVVVATSDQPPLMRIRAALTATRIAEWFRDQGEDVLLIMDSLTRLAMAQREVGISTGEPPTMRGYPPSVGSLMARLLERAGSSDQGSITALYTVLVDGDDMLDPVADAARSILDGHITLSRARAQMSRYPAVDVLDSVSRLESSILTDDQRLLVQAARRMLAVYQSSVDLIEVGAYRAGVNPQLDLAITLRERLEDVFCQDVHELSPLETSWSRLTEAMGGAG